MHVFADLRNNDNYICNWNNFETILKSKQVNSFEAKRQA
jgi:hypothetical protein